MGANKCVTKCLLIEPIRYGFITHSFLRVLATLWSFVDHKQTAYTNHLNGMYLACSAAAYYLSTEKRSKMDAVPSILFSFRLSRSLIEYSANEIFR